MAKSNFLYILSYSLNRDKCEVLSVIVYLAQIHWSLLCLPFAIFHDFQVAFHDIQVAIYRDKSHTIAIFFTTYRDKFLALSRPPTVHYLP